MINIYSNFNINAKKEELKVDSMKRIQFQA